MSLGRIVASPYRAALILAGVIVATIIGYTLSVSLPLLQGPLLAVIEPSGGSESGIAHIAGETKRVAFLEINGEEVPLSEDGSFSVYRAYPPGYTAVEIKARDRFGREIRKTFAFITTYSNPLTHNGIKEKED